MRPSPFRRYALAVAACELIPVPLVDTLAQNRVRRAAVRRAARMWGVPLTVDEVEAIADEELGTLRRLVWGLVKWPVKKLLRTVFFFLIPWRMWLARGDLRRRVGEVTAPAGPRTARPQTVARRPR